MTLSRSERFLAAVNKLGNLSSADMLSERLALKRFGGLTGSRSSAAMKSRRRDRCLALYAQTTSPRYEAVNQRGSSNHGSTHAPQDDSLPEVRVSEQDGQVKRRGPGR